MKMFVFNVIEPVRRGKRTHLVRLCIAMAETMEVARAKVAAECKDECSLTWRNDFEGDEVFTWSFQHWDKSAVKECNPEPVRNFASNRQRGDLLEEIN